MMLTLGIIIGLLVAILVTILATRYQAPLTQRTKAILSSIQPKGRIIEDEPEEVSQWVDSLKEA